MHSILFVSKEHNMEKRQNILGSIIWDANDPNQDGITPLSRSSQSKLFAHAQDSITQELKKLSELLKQYKKEKNKWSIKNMKPFIREAIRQLEEGNYYNSDYL